MPKVVLYDLPSTPPCKTWSLNPWKTRMVLNYKGIDYETEWVEYPDLAPTFKSYGIPPNDKNDPGYFVDYTSPAIKFDDGTYCMDSLKIARELEKRYPSPSLHLDDPLVANFTLNKCFEPLAARVLTRIPRILPERSAEYFHRTRTEAFGMPLAQYEKEHAKEEDWEVVKERAKPLADLLKKNEGPFFLGETVSYADFIFVTFIAFMGRANEDVLRRFLSIDETFGTVFDACQQWM